MKWLITTFLVVIAIWAYPVWCSTVADNAYKDIIRQQKNTENYPPKLKTLVRQLQDDCEKNIRSLKKRNNGKLTQYLIAAAVKVQTNGGKYRFEVEQSLYYENMKFKEFFESDDGREAQQEIAQIKTNYYLEFKQEDTVHTELQLLYGKNGRELLREAGNKDNLVLVFSYFTPCSQNIKSFGECAGDMGEYLAQRNTKTKFIVVHGKPWRAKDKPNLNTNQCVSTLYMDQAGIISYSMEITHGEIQLEYQGPHSYVDEPHFQPFPRETQVKTRVLQLAMCLFKADFLQENRITTSVGPGDTDSQKLEVLKFLDDIGLLIEGRKKGFRQITSDYFQNNQRHLNIKYFDKCVKFTNCFPNLPLTPCRALTQRILPNNFASILHNYGCLPQVEWQMKFQTKIQQLERNSTNKISH